MTLEEIRSQLINDLQTDINNWDDVINNTLPGNYGSQDWDVSVPENRFFVNIPDGSFSFKDVDFSASLLLGASRGDSSILQEFRTSVKGKGTFEFVNNKKVRITNIEIDPDTNLDIFSE